MSQRTRMRRRTAPPAALRAIEALRAEDRGAITRLERQAILDEIAEQLHDELELPFGQEGEDE